MDNSDNKAKVGKNNVLKNTIKENLRNGLYKNYCKNIKLPD